MKKAQRGVALITAVLVVALAAIAAAAMLGSANLSIHRTQNLQDSELSWWYAVGVEAWVKTILQRDADLNRTDSFKDIWAVPVTYLPIDQGSLRGTISDLQGRFNLNNLGVAQLPLYQQQLQIFTRLLAITDGVDDYQAKALAAAIRDYIDTDSEPTGSEGGEDSDYLSLNPPRRVPNRPMQSPSELLAVKGVTPEIYGKLVGNICALPLLNGAATTINVNTATPALLHALTPKPGAGLDQFIAERAQKPAESVAELFNTRKALDSQAVPNNLLGVSSSYFELNAEVFVGSGRLALYSFYYRPGTGAPLILGRSTFTE